MKQIYYTQEGTAYYLRSASRLIRSLPIAINTGLNPNVTFNEAVNNVNPNSPDTIYVETGKAIIPLLMFYNVINTAVGVTLCSNQMPYWSVQNVGTGTPITNANGLTPLLKNLANVETQYKEIPIPAFPAQPLNDKYGIKYNQCVYSEKDFITLENKTIVAFRTTPDAITVGVPIVQGVMSAGNNYAISQSVIYFELVK
jgi:hypothetical protein